MQPSFAGDRHSPRTSPALRSASAAGRRSGTRYGVRPKIRRTTRAQPSERSRWTMCVNSCVKIRRSQSSKSELGSRRRHRVQDDGVVRHRRRVAVEQLGLVGQHDPRPARRGQTERLLERPPRLFGDARQAPREPIFALMKIDDEMFGRQRDGSGSAGSNSCADAALAAHTTATAAATSAPIGRLAFSHRSGVHDPAAAGVDSRVARARTMQRMSAGTPSRPAPMKKSP